MRNAIIRCKPDFFKPNLESGLVLKAAKGSLIKRNHLIRAARPIALGAVKVKENSIQFYD
ncbi:hypothetical protein ROBYS_39960 [Roseobacter sp. OBYS 0001]|nr:hypothetical protein ROBYS_39960 [Roseobacter sp. OBYS 0001]